jgi:microcystin-dependent protein
VTRLLSDPSFFPMEFRAWIKNYIESSDITFPASSILGLGSSASGRTQLPPGIILAYGGDTYGPDVVPCNGASLDAHDYDLLFAAIGTKWGSVDADHFNVPDLRDRTIYGAGSVVALGATDGKALGSRGGPHHHHGINMATDSGGVHKHNAGSGAFVVTGSGLMDPTGGGGYTLAAIGQTANSPAHSHVINGDTSGGYDNNPSYAGVGYVITTGK